MSDIATTPISGWASTAATQTTICPKCGAQYGEYCRTPTGRFTTGRMPHMERSAAYLASIGREEFDKRHSVKMKTFDEIFRQ